LSQNAESQETPAFPDFCVLKIDSGNLSFFSPSWRALRLAPLAPVDLLSLLRPAGRSCHRRAGRFASQESGMGEAGALHASPPAKGGVPLRRSASFYVAKMRFFTAPASR